MKMGGEAPFSSMLRMSNLVYSLGDLRQIVLDHGANFNEEMTEKEKKENNIVEFDTPALVITKKSTGRVFQSTLLKHEVTADNVLQFIKKNRRYLTNDDSGKIIFDTSGMNTEPLPIEKKLEALKGKFDADIIEFDDDEANKGLKSQLLYGIVVNRSDKRITVVFRGSVNARDWLQNAKFTRKKTPEISEFADDDAKMHTGFTNYLFSRLHKHDNSKYEQIMDVLEDVYTYKASGRDYSDYDMFITGHSLGGALTQIMAFTLAGSQRAREFLPAGKPVTAMSYASPEVGSKGYLKKFNELEKKGALRHIRVSNQGDAVPIAFNTGTPWAGFKQPGVNVHISPNKKAVVGHNTIQKFAINPLKALERHSPLSHRKHLFLENGLNDEILSKSVEEIYAEHANL